MKAIVTVKIKQDVEHNPHRKLNGICPVSGLICTDITGEHHSIIVEGDSLLDIRAKVNKKGYKHITRIEVVE